MGQRFLRATHQSGQGMVQVFETMANEAAMHGAYKNPFISDHPADRERIDLLQRLSTPRPIATSRTARNRCTSSI